MDSLYTIVLLVSRATGGVEAIEAGGPFAGDGCKQMIQLTRMLSGQEAPGYDTKMSCVTRPQLEQVIAQHHCSLTGSEDTHGIATHTYACEPSTWGRLKRWAQSLFE